ncbi:hypothetical protein HFD98_24595 [Pseudomonas sp. EKM23D]|uniref:hypothetical protein n=1 Tax=Pseudomonas sp. EKM23D TaxID=2708062 RepID=UPI00142E791A|nr:hypothetical protein [Pseudomonas sp. EKM23D]KAF6687218.1 hypothetical protein HFD98_24595 [Pseudomonas sp. EKM23D]
MLESRDQELQGLVAVLITARMQGLNLDFLCNRSIGSLVGDSSIRISDAVNLDQVVTDIEAAKLIVNEMLPRTVED